jgi:acyl-CoA thioester hydrolase
VSAAFCYYLRVRYQECDAQHVVFNARYGDFIDLACFEFLRAALPSPTACSDGSFETQTVRQLVEWKGSARFDDVLAVSVRTSRVGSTSFTLNFDIRRAGEEQVLATCETTYVHVDKASYNKRSIAPHIRAALERGAPGKSVDHAGHCRCVPAAGAGDCGARPDEAC